MATVKVYVYAPSSYYADKDLIGNNKNTIYAIVHDAVNADGYENNNYGIISQMAELLDAEDDTWDITIQRTFMYFPTYNIPEGAIIDSVTLYIKAAYLPGTNFVLQVQRGTELDENGVPIIHHVPFQVSDFNYTGISGNGGSVNTSTFTQTEVFYPITFDVIGRSWINKGTGAVTKLILRHQGDINAIAPDDNGQFLWFYMVGTKRAYLIIEYTPSIVIPTVTTQAVSDILMITATGNGNITNTGGENATKRGICYNLTGSPTIADSKVEETGSFGTGAFTETIVGLSLGTKYYVKAYAYNSAGYGYGEEVEFTTLIPVVTTEAAEVSVPVSNPAYCEFATGNGTIVSAINATERGFEVKLVISASLYDAIVHEMAGFVGDVDYNIDTGKWEGTLIKIEHEHGDFAEGTFTLELGAFPAFFYDKLFAGESYTYRVYAIIDGVKYYEVPEKWVAFSLGVYTGEGSPSPTDDISDGNPTEPIIPILPSEPYPPFVWTPPELIPYPPWDFDLPETPPWVLPDLPPWEIPDYPSDSFVGDFYYRKSYTAKDLDELRAKCIIYNKNSVEFALVLRHNMNVLKEFFNMMTDYMGKEEFNDFTDLIPPQRLKELSLDPLNPIDFRDIINEFIRNTTDNNIAVNRNFNLIQEGLSDYETGSDNAYFTEIISSVKTLEQDDPDVERMKTLIDSLNEEVSSNFNDITHNLNIIKARLL